MFCKYCGKELDDGSAFCKYCGKSQTAVNPAPAQPSAEAAAQEHTTHKQVQSPVQNILSKAAQSAAEGAAAAAGAAQHNHRDNPKLKRLQATLKLLSFTGWGCLILGTLFGVIGVLMLAVFLLTPDMEILPGIAVCLFVALWGYIFGVYQFWNAAGVEQQLTLALPETMSEAEWIEKIRNEFSFQGAVLQENQPDNALVYLLNDARMHLTAENGVLHIRVQHSKRFRSANSGGHWELQESFSADDLKCALAYFVAGQPLPESFAQEQKLRHKDKVGKVKVGLYVGTAAALVLVFIISVFPVSPLSSLKNSTWSEYSTTGQTLGEAFENNFDSPSWSQYEKDGREYIRFDGIIDFGDLGESLVDVEFSVKKTEDNYYFLIEEARLDGTILSDTETSILMQYGFTGDTDELIGSMFLSALFG